MLWAASVVHIGLFLLEPLSQKSGNLDQIGHEKVRKSDSLLAVDTLFKFSKYIHNFKPKIKIS